VASTVTLEALLEHLDAPQTRGMPMGEQAT
jgi:hypothetical protein